MGVKAAVVGGGNVGTQFAVHLAAKGFETYLYTSKPQLFSHTLTIVDENGTERLHGEVAATSDPREAFEGAEIIFVTVPAFMAEETAKTVCPFVGRGTKVGLVPGTGGMEFAFSETLGRGGVLFGLQRVPSVARLKEYGKTVCASGYREKLCLASIPSTECRVCCELVTYIFDMPCEALPNYLAVTMTPSNPILHTSRLYSLFREYREGTIYTHVPLFYEEWTDASSELLFACDGEVQAICAAFPEFDLSDVRSLRLHYESETPQQLTAKITSIASFRGIETPMRAVEGGYIPDFSSRYFTADFPFGLSILRQIALFAGVKTPCLDKIYKWYAALAHDPVHFSYEKYGIYSRDDFVRFYSH